MKVEEMFYFAYGSNMSTAKFIGSRGIKPQAKMAVTVPRWCLGMPVPGLPYSEPAFSAIKPRDDPTTPDVHGVLYLISQEQFLQVVASEGGGTAYGLVNISALPLFEEDRRRFGNCIEAVSLIAEMKRTPNGLPSVRYMTLLLDGAREAGLSEEYRMYLAKQPTYAPPDRGRALLGATVFLRLFSPVMAALEVLTEITTGEDGRAPQWVISVVRTVVFGLWAVHDLIFAPIFGRGDGLGAVAVTRQLPCNHLIDVEKHCPALLKPMRG